MNVNKPTDLMEILHESEMPVNVSQIHHFLDMGWFLSLENLM